MVRVVDSNSHGCFGGSCRQIVAASGDVGVFRPPLVTVVPLSAVQGLTAHYSLLTTHYSLLTTLYLLHTTYHSPLTALQVFLSPSYKVDQDITIRLR